MAQKQVSRSILKHTLVSITTSPTKLPTTPLSGRDSIFIQNLSTVIVYIGQSDVATTGARTGIVLPSQYDNVTIEVESNVDIYGIVATGTANVVIMETR